MAKKIILGAIFSLFLTIVFWNVTGLVSFGRQTDDIVVLASPILAIVISVVLVRSRLMAGNRSGENAGI